MAPAATPLRKPQIDDVPDRAAIEALLATYLDGVYESNADKFLTIFHPAAHLYFLDEAGKVTDWPRDHWLDMVRKRTSPKSQGHPRHDRIVHIDQSGPASAFAKVECAAPPRFFVDYLSLLKTNEGWRIIAKVFKAETR
ncbi:MAG: nuclear transport factor 2 family protein [Variibacter sp.]